MKGCLSVTEATADYRGPKWLSWLFPPSAEPACTAQDKGRAGCDGATGCHFVFLETAENPGGDTESNKETLGSARMGTDTTVCLFPEGE